MATCCIQTLQGIYALSPLTILACCELKGLKYYITGNRDNSNAASTKTSASQGKVFGHIFQQFHSKSYKQLKNNPPPSSPPPQKKKNGIDSLKTSHFQIGYRLSMHVHEHTLIQNPAALKHHQTQTKN